MTRTLALLLLVGCSEYNVSKRNKVKDGTDTDDTQDSVTVLPEVCVLPEVLDEEVGPSDVCEPVVPPQGGFTPIVEWTAGNNRGCTALPVVGDLDGDGVPEIVANFTKGLLGNGKLVVMNGKTGQVIWSRNAELGYGAAPALADIMGDARPEILVTRHHGRGLGLNSRFSVVAYDYLGNELWQSQIYHNVDFDYATAISVADMDHDGSPEIIAGRVILNADGTTRGVGEYGHGSWGKLPNPLGEPIYEGAISAVADLDLDGTDEVIVGDAIYDPDGNTLWHDASQPDGMIAIANLDNDPEGEVLITSYNTIRARDTNGQVMWTHEIPSGNILSVAAVGDLDGDGKPEIVVAGGNKLRVLNRKGKKQWSADVTDESGATGAAIFDFEGDGFPEVVYIDEVEMIAFDGKTGQVKFYNTNHASPTMMDYPVVADVDNDGHAEIVVCHSGLGHAISVFGDANNSWVPARKVWNQHAYSINNINDDLSVPVQPDQGFATHNMWHGAIDSATIKASIDDDIEGEIVEVCDVVCEGPVPVVGRIINRGPNEVPAGIPASLYVRDQGIDALVQTVLSTVPVSSGQKGEALVFEIDADQLQAAESLWMVVDDDGAGGETIEECAEFNNGFLRAGPFCD